MNIGIVGEGVVGGACKFGFQKLGHKVLVHDLKYNTTIDAVLESSIVFICVPTNAKEDGSCDTSIVREVLSQLNSNGYEGTVIIKSTTVPGTTRKFELEFPSLKLGFVPEFLRERCAVADFVEHHHLLAIGVSTSYPTEQREEMIKAVKDSHGNYPRSVRVLTSTQAELLKYYSNIFNAMRIIFANEMYEVTTALGEEYTPIKDAFISKGGIDNIYLDVNDNFRGYGGTCLPKDVKAMAYLVKKLNLDLNLFKTLDEENDKFERTVFDGMRL